MTASGVAQAVAFNVFLNAVGSFLGAAAAVAFVRRLVRPPHGAWTQLLLALPLAKVVLDVLRGIPDRSFLWVQQGGGRQDLGEVRIEFGLPHFIPVMRVHLAAWSGGERYPQSIAELGHTLLTRKVAPAAPLVATVLALSIGVVLLTLRVARSVRSVRETHKVVASGRLVGQRMLGRRNVRIVVSERYEGVPFVLGLMQPTICLSLALQDALTAAELDAVIAHELGHVARHDLLQFAALGCMADLFWYVPLLRRHCTALRLQAEHAADRWATRKGIPGEVLASALVRAAEHARGAGATGFGLVNPKSSVAGRVQDLLSVSSSRGSSVRLAGRALLVTAFAASVLSSSLLGNG